MEWSSWLSPETWSIRRELARTDYNQYFLVSNRPAKISRALYHFLLIGELEVVRGYRRLPFAYQGARPDYVEKLYLLGNPDVAEMVAEGHYSSGVRHFLARGLREIRSGKRKPYDASSISELKGRFKGGAEKDGDVLAYFAHTESFGGVSGYVERYLRGLRALGASIVFSTHVDRTRIPREILSLCSEVLVVKGPYNPFNGWALALEHSGYNPSDFETVLLANDRSYFPVHSPEHMLAYMREKAFDFWGMSDSAQGVRTNQYHIQADFFGLGRRALDSGVLATLVETFKAQPVLSDRGYIETVCFAVAEAALQAGLRMGAYCTVEEVYDVARSENRKTPHYAGVDPSLSWWRQQLNHFKSPVLRTDLALIDPIASFSWPDAWAVIDKELFDPNLIREHGRNVGSGTPWIDSDVRRAETDVGMLLKGGLGSRPVQVSAYTLLGTEKDLLRRELVWSRTDAAPKRQTPLEVIRRIDRSAFIKGKGLCFFAHYDEGGRIAPYVLHYLKGLVDCGYQIVFITSMEDEAEFAKLPPECRRVLIKTNTGRDFGSWWLGIKDFEDAVEYDEYLIANDSIYFPIGDPKPMFEKMRREGYEMWGVTDSYSTRWHVNSYFWVFNHALYHSDFRERFLDEYRLSYSKYEQIRNYETRYALLYRNMGKKVGSFLHAQEVGEFVKLRRKKHPRHSAVGGRFNMNHEFWDVLLKDFHSPLLKILLLRENPLKVENLSEVREVVESVGYDYNLIYSHLGFHPK